MAYSHDYRQIILDKLAHGYSIRAVANEFNLSTNTVQAWKKDVTRKKRQSKPTKIKDELLIADVKQYPDAYHHERAIRLNCSKSGIAVALKRLGLTQKKESKSP